METRPNVSVTVVTAPTMSRSFVGLTSWSATALSLRLPRRSAPRVVTPSVDRCSARAAALPGRTLRRRHGFAERADLSQCRFRRTLSAFPGAIDRAPQGFVGCLAREEQAAQGFGEDFSRALPAGRSNRHRAERERRSIPARHARFLQRSCNVAAE